MKKSLHDGGSGLPAWADKAARHESLSDADVDQLMADAINDPMLSSVWRRGVNQLVCEHRMMTEVLREAPR